jgi:Ca2+-binding RTX toxin-like protein
VATVKTITIDASSAAGGINLGTYFDTYFAGLSTTSTIFPTFHGAGENATPDTVGGRSVWYHGTQIGFRYKNLSGTETDKQVFIEGDNLAYDGIHYGSTYGHGISGTINSLTFGTRATAQSAGKDKLTGVISELKISGLDISAPVGFGHINNPAYNLYDALQNAGKNPAAVDAVEATVATYSQNILGSAFADTFVASSNDDTVKGAGGNDTIDGGVGDDLAVFSGRRSDYTIIQNNDGSFTITDERSTGSEGVDTVSNVENFQFSDSVVTSGNVVAQQGVIVIDASGADGMDFEAFIRGGFTSDVEGAGMPTFDNKSGQFAGKEMFLGYGADAASKYVFAHGDLQYSFGTHTVAGTINTIEYGTRGGGSFDGNGYFIGGNAQLKISGMELFNAVPNNGAEEIEIEANGPVHNFALAYMYGKAASADRLNKYADALDNYAQKFIGSSKTDFYAGTVFADTISGGGGDDVFGATKGNDTIDGGADLDQVVFSGNRADYDVTKQEDGSYTIALKDGNGMTTLKKVEFAAFSDVTLDTVRGVELPGRPPQGVSLSKSSVLENAKVGDAIGVFSATDPENKELTFSLVDDAGGLFEISGSTLRVKGNLDYETSKDHKVRIKVSDADGHIVFEDFSISVENSDEGPQNILISKSIISETAEVGTRVGMLSAEDPEKGAVTYSLTGNPGGYFALTADGKLTLAKRLDYEKAQSHTLTIQAKDSTGQATTQTIKIDVGDVLEARNGTARNDVMTGKIGKDKLSGGAGSDRLAGNGGDDKLYGGSGNDKLTGGQGADDLWGGSGADTFIFKSIKETTVSSIGRDTIFDFSTGQRDKIHLSSIDANALKGGNQAFSFIGTKAFAGKAGELRYEKAKSDTYIYGDVNGDKVADFAIHLDDRVNLTKSYFVL